MRNKTNITPKSANTHSQLDSPYQKCQNQRHFDVLCAAGNSILTHRSGYDQRNGRSWSGNHVPG